MLANDSDADGDPLSATVVDQPQFGTLTPNPDGSFSYTPQAGFVGADSFTYRASDGLLNSELTTVSIQVVHQNLPPLAVDDSATLAEDRQIVIQVLENDRDDMAASSLSVICSRSRNTGGCKYRQMAACSTCRTQITLVKMRLAIN